MSQRKPPDDASTRAFSHGEGEEEPAVRIGRNVITGGNPAATPADRTRPLGAEPKPVASPRPAPYQDQRVSAKATLLMTEANPPQAAKAAPGRAPAQRAEPPSAMSAGRQAGGSLSQQDAEMPERPRTSVQPRAKVAPAPATSNRPAGPKSPPPPESTQPVLAHGSDT
jgi:hypothetical protein